jgi:membrane-associated progesterone receptor component
MSSETTVSDYFLYIATALAVAVAYLKLRSSSSMSSSSTITSVSSPSSSTPVDPNRPFTLAELKQFDGSDSTKPLYLGCLGKVFDVSSASAFYGPDGAYGVFAGRDASRGLAKMEISYSSADISDLSPSEKQTLKEWHDKYTMKYPIVGVIKDDSEPNSGSQ